MLDVHGIKISDPLLLLILYPFFACILALGWFFTRFRDDRSTLVIRLRAFGAVLTISNSHGPVDKTMDDRGNPLSGEKDLANGQ